MESKTVLVAGLTLLVGGVVGFVAGYSIATGRKDEEVNQLKDALKERDSSEKKEEPEEPKEEPVKQVKVNKAKIATPKSNGTDYTKYNHIIESEKYAAESESPTEEDLEEDDEEEDEDLEETYEERLEREAEELNEQDRAYEKKEGKKIKVLGNKQMDFEYPDVMYPAEEIYYFTEDDILTTEDGEVITNEEEWIGPALRRFGWMQNAEEFVWVRNNPRDTDYKVIKQKCSREDFFGVTDE